jgi:hypothetical protein
MDDGAALEGFDLRPMFVPLAARSELIDVHHVLAESGYAGSLLDHPDDDADHAFVLILVDEWGEPLRWRTDVGVPRFISDSTSSLRAVMEHRFGRGVRIAGDDEDGLDANSPHPGLGITSMVWYTFKNLDDFGGLVAGAIGAPVVVAPLDRSHAYAPLGNRERLLDDDLPESHQSILLWKTATRRGVFIRKRRVRALHWWDEAAVLIDPSDSRPLLGLDLRVADMVAALRGDQGDVISDIGTAFRLEAEAAERLRILCRRPRSDDSTFSDLVTILGLPAELADLADGRLDPADLPAAVVKHPQTLRQNFAEDWSEIRSVFREPAADRSRSPFDAWQRLTARRPLWYTLLTVLIVGVSAAVAVMRLLDGAGFLAIWIQLAVIVLWTGSYVAPRRRFLLPVEDTAQAEPTQQKTEDTGPH